MLRSRTLGALLIGGAAAACVLFSPDILLVPGRAMGRVYLAAQHGLDAEANRTHVNPHLVNLPADELLHGVQERLSARGHTYRSDLHAKDESSLDSLTARQLQVVDALLRSLENPAVRADLGSQLDADLADQSTEHGGLALYRGGLVFQDIPADLSAAGNEGYATPRRAIAEPHLAHYHLHATRDDNSAEAGPSQPDRLFCEILADAFGEYHCVVFSQLPGRALNADYYGGDFSSENAYGEAAPSVLLDLGDYGY